jgi:hypothetical protein
MFINLNEHCASFLVLIGEVELLGGGEGVLDVSSSAL